MLNYLKLLRWTKTRNQGKKKIQKITQEIIYSKKQKQKFKGGNLWQRNQEGRENFF